MQRIPVYKPDLGGNEREYVLDCIDSGWISSIGKYVAEFETAFGRYTGLDHCTTVSSGTTALQTAVGALGLGPGDEVLVPTLTYIAPANAVRWTGADVVLTDCRKDSWQMDPDDAARRITDRTKAIVVVHLYGGMCEMDRFVELAQEHDLYLIEDCAEAFGSRYNGQVAGSFGDVGAFSFFGNKTITTGEGGMVSARSQDLYEKAIRFKNQGLPGGGREYWHEFIGFNYRMTNLSAAVGLAQLERADSILQKKRQLAQWYEHFLEDVPVELQPEPEGVSHSYWMVSIVCSDSASVRPLRIMLDREGIETRPVFPPIHAMPMYRNPVVADSFPNAVDISERGINLPSWPGLGEEDIARIAGAVRSYYGSAG